MSIQEQILLMLGMAVITFLARYPMLAFVSRIKLPDLLVRGLRYAPVAVLTALIIPTALMPDDTLQLGFSNPGVLGLLVSALVAWRTQNVIYTIVLGTATVILLRLFVL